MSSSRNFRHALTVNKVASRFVEAGKAAADKIDKSKLFDLLDGAEKTVDNTGTWKSTFQGFDLWIGAPGGSRSKQYEGDVRKGGRSIQFRARSFSSLKNQFLKQLQGFEG